MPLLPLAPFPVYVQRCAARLRRTIRPVIRAALSHPIPVLNRYDPSCAAVNRSKLKRLRWKNACAEGISAGRRDRVLLHNTVRRHLQTGDDEHKRTVRTNLKDAAGELGLALEFHPFKDKRRMHFRVMTLEEKAARPYRGGGRPKKAHPEVAQETIEEAPQEPGGTSTEPEAPPAARPRRRRN